MSDIYDVLEHYGAVVPHRRGGWTPMRCYVHDDSSPSAQVNADKGRWGCFVCGLSEDAYAVVMREEGLGFRDAKRRVEEITGSGVQHVPAEPGTRRFLFDETGPTGTGGRYVQAGDRQPGGAGR